MVSLQKGFGGDSTTAKSFEDIYKMAYSHGLETIYALENVDVKSIRRLQDAPSFAPEEVSSTRLLPAKAPQRFFDFGPGFRDWVEPFYAFEPIQVLGLSKQAEKCLIEHGKPLLGDLLKCDLRSLVFLKGMGQGHIDEIKTKLRLYLDGREVHQAHSIDFISWLRCVTVCVNARKKVFLCLDAYDLGHLLPLTPAEAMELRRLSDDLKEEWIQEGFAELAQTAKSAFVRDRIDQLATVFVKPWVRGRLGLATLDEIRERLERVSLAPEAARKALPFFSDVYYDALFPFKDNLFEVESDIYAADEWTARAYGVVVEQARTYFYKQGIHYPFLQLVQLLKREFARSWTGFAEGFIEKALRLSGEFSVHKGRGGSLEVRLNGG